MYIYILIKVLNKTCVVEALKRIEPKNLKTSELYDFWKFSISDFVTCLVTFQSDLNLELTFVTLNIVHFHKILNYCHHLCGLIRVPLSSGVVLGRVVQKPISYNPGLKFNRLFILCSVFLGCFFPK